MSTCVKCGGHRFEAKEVEPVGSRFVQIFIQCATCGGVVGVTPAVNTNVLVERLAKALKVKL